MSLCGLVHADPQRLGLHSQKLRFSGLSLPEEERNIRRFHKTCFYSLGLRGASLENKVTMIDRNYERLVP